MYIGFNIGILISLNSCQKIVWIKFYIDFTNFMKPSKTMKAWNPRNPKERRPNFPIASVSRNFRKLPIFSRISNMRTAHQSHSIFVQSIHIQCHNSRQSYFKVVKLLDYADLWPILSYEVWNSPRIQISTSQNWPYSWILTHSRKGLSIFKSLYTYP